MRGLRIAAEAQAGQETLRQVRGEMTTAMILRSGDKIKIETFQEKVFLTVHRVPRETVSSEEEFTMSPTTTMLLAENSKIGAALEFEVE